MENRRSRTGLTGNKGNKEELGAKEIETLLSDFGVGKVDKEKSSHPPLIEREATRQEWAVLNEVGGQQHYPTFNMKQLWKIIAENHRETFPI